jgi:hypothetical protein
MKKECARKRIHASAGVGEDIKSFWPKHEENESRKPMPEFLNQFT